MLKLNCALIEKCTTETVSVGAYGETYEQTQIIVHVRPLKRMQGLCPKCMRCCVCNGLKQKEKSRWRASNFNGMPVFILYRPQRILCPEHGALNEYIPWADGNSRFTEAFNDEVAWLVCKLSKTAICQFIGINWRTVGNCVEASHRRLEPDIRNRLHDNVRHICVDETSYKKGHKYITVVYDMDKNKVIWISQGHGADVFTEFCNQLPPEERSNIEIVAGDGAKWIDSCMKYFPKATRCIDFFHDDMRISVATKAKQEYNNLKNKYIQSEKAVKETEEN